MIVGNNGIREIPPKIQVIDFIIRILVSFLGKSYSMN